MSLVQRALSVGHQTRMLNLVPPSRASSISRGRSPSTSSNTGRILPQNTATSSNTGRILPQIPTTSSNTGRILPQTPPTQDLQPIRIPKPPGWRQSAAESFRALTASESAQNPTGRSRYRFQCISQQCVCAGTRKFTRKSDAERHWLGEHHKEWKCPLCGHTGRQHSHVLVHINARHLRDTENATLYECRYGCGLKWHDQSPRTKHERQCANNPQASSSTSQQASSSTSRQLPVSAPSPQAEQGIPIAAEAGPSQFAQDALHSAGMNGGVQFSHFVPGQTFFPSIEPTLPTDMDFEMTPSSATQVFETLGEQQMGPSPGWCHPHGNGVPNVDLNTGSAITLTYNNDVTFSGYAPAQQSPFLGYVSSSPDSGSQTSDGNPMETGLSYDPQAWVGWDTSMSQSNDHVASGANGTGMEWTTPGRMYGPTHLDQEFEDLIDYSSCS